VDGQNGLLLTPHVDLLFDRGWISFRDDGQILINEHLPKQVREALSIRAIPLRQSSALSTAQCRFMSFHRDVVFASASSQAEIALKKASLGPNNS